MKKILLKDLKKNLPFKMKYLFRYLFWREEKNYGWHKVAFIHYEHEEFEITPTNTKNLNQLLTLIVNLFDDNENWIAFLNCKRKLIKEDFKNKFVTNNMKRLMQNFLQNKINYDFEGGLELSTNEFVDIFNDLIMYPFDQRYDIFVSKKNMPFVIQLNQHYEVVIPSTDIELIKSVINDDNFPKLFKVRIANGTII